MGGTFLGVDGLLKNLLRFRQRANPLVVVELLRGLFFLLLQEHQLCVEQKAALFQEVSRCSLDREDVETPK